jgi:hypothetical protein
LQEPYFLAWRELPETVRDDLCAHFDPLRLSKLISRLLPETTHVH